MNSKYLPAALIVAGVIAGVTWWFWPAAPGQETAPVAAAESPSGEEAMPGADASPEPAVMAEAPPAPPAPDPQLEVGTAVADFIRIAQSGDMITLMKNYMPPDQMAKIPPEELVNMALQMQAMMQNPADSQRMQTMIAEMQSIQNAVPTYDATGNRATYTLPAGSMEPQIIFVRQDGRWYRE